MRISPLDVHDKAIAQVTYGIREDDSVCIRRRAQERSFMKTVIESPSFANAICSAVRAGCNTSGPLDSLRAKYTAHSGNELVTNELAGNKPTH